MKILEYKLSFATPAFLGNAEQSGQWRTPPFKALIRHWWRIAYVADKPVNPDLIANMREAEHRLFGTISASNGSANKSALRLRLNHWNIGRGTKWQDDTRVTHPEVKHPIGAQLYLGYGPLTYQAGSTKQKADATIHTHESAQLKIAVPEKDLNTLITALSLIHNFGALGGRSRNGWGSLLLEPGEVTPELPNLQSHSLTRDWQTALQNDWPHCIGAMQGRPLVWETPAANNWQEVMTMLAKIKIACRVQFPFSGGKSHSKPQDRHCLSYPVTNHDVRDWGKNLRLPNSLRFKVRPGADNKLHGIIFHMPCKPPAEFQPQPANIDEVWKKVYSLLDLLCEPYEQRQSMLAKKYRAELSDTLKSLELKRIEL